MACVYLWLSSFSVWYATGVAIILSILSPNWQRKLTAKQGTNMVDYPPPPPPPPPFTLGLAMLPWWCTSAFLNHFVAVCALVRCDVRYWPVQSEVTKTTVLCSFFVFLFISVYTPVRNLILTCGRQRVHHRPPRKRCQSLALVSTLLTAPVHATRAVHSLSS